MGMICYKSKTFTAATRDIIDRANEIIKEYHNQGFRLTLRQLYYQFVARDWLPNRQQSYKRLGSILGDARNAGLVDWDTIEDRTRELRDLAHWSSPSQVLQTCAQQFRYDLWADQEYRLEVWIEKDALLGVFEPMCEQLDVPLFSCRGYTSLSASWAAGRRLRSYSKLDQIPIILHFGDHDPSGIDMTRDIADHLSLYAEEKIEVERLALNMDQVQEYNPPHNPAKITDSRYASYVAIYGDKSWELDALEPAVIAKLICLNVLQYRDDEIWKQSTERQMNARKRLQALADNWDESDSGS